ncbi:MAG: hypothetical protein AAGF12_14385 [Myxococcota bacterium]
MVVPATAFAHPLIDEAQRLFSEADFEGALAAYTRAEDADDLSRDDLVDLYVSRALLHHVLENGDDVDIDMFRLATLEPDYSFGNQVPPAVVERFRTQAARVTDRVKVELQVETHAGGIRLQGIVQNDVTGMVRTVRLGVRKPGNAWTRRQNSALEFATSSDETIEYYVEAVGPGGAVVASSGSSTHPNVSEVGVLLGGGPANGNGEPVEPPSDGVPAWPFIVGGSVLAVAGAALLIVLLAGGNDNTSLSGPMVQGQ